MVEAIEPSRNREPSPLPFSQRLRRSGTYGAMARSRDWIVQIGLNTADALPEAPSLPYPHRRTLVVHHLAEEYSEEKLQWLRLKPESLRNSERIYSQIDSVWKHVYDELSKDHYEHFLMHLPLQKAVKDVLLWAIQWDKPNATAKELLERYAPVLTAEDLQPPRRKNILPYAQW